MYRISRSQRKKQKDHDNDHETDNVEKEETHDTDAAPTTATAVSVPTDNVAVNVDVSVDDGNAAPDSAAPSAEPTAEPTADPTAAPAAADSEVNMNNIAASVVADVVADVDAAMAAAAAAQDEETVVLSAAGRAEAEASEPSAKDSLVIGTETDGVSTTDTIHATGTETAAPQESEPKKDMTVAYTAADAASKSPTPTKEPNTKQDPSTESKTTPNSLSASAAEAEAAAAAEESENDNRTMQMPALPLPDMEIAGKLCDEAIATASAAAGLGIGIIADADAHMASASISVSEDVVVNADNDVASATGKKRKRSNAANAAGGKAGDEELEDGNGDDNNGDVTGHEDGDGDDSKPAEKKSKTNMGKATKMKSEPADLGNIDDDDDIMSTCTTPSTTSAPRKRISWEERIAELQKFKTEFGHCRISQRSKNYLDLGRFVKKIREYKSRIDRGATSGTGVLTPERVVQLESLGFEWSVKKVKCKTFDERMVELKAYKERFGNCDVPRIWEEDMSLARWCHVMRSSRRQIKEGKKPMYKLTQAEIDQLEEEGFKWALIATPRQRVKIKSFEERIEELKAFKEKHGHVSVTSNFDKNLAVFCSHMRNARRDPNKRNGVKMSKERIQALNELGFDWGANEKRKANYGRISFEQRIERLKEFKEKHGHLKVTHKLDSSLAEFCSNMRLSRRSGPRGGMACTEERIKALDAVGFDWNQSRATGDATPFEERIKQLKAFKAEHGHLRVTSKLNKNLANFCTNMRSSRKRPGVSGGLTVSEERIKALDEIGFEWQPPRDLIPFNVRIEQLKKFKEEHGHLRVTPKLDKNLATFCTNMRSARRKPDGAPGMTVSEERLKALDELGFEWSPPRATGDAVSFSERLEQLRLFKEKQGHLRVTQKFDKNLATFCTNMRSARRKSAEKGPGGLSVTEERIKALDDLGFDWEPSFDDSKSFAERIEELKEFKAEHGHLAVTTKHRNLSLFCNKMRSKKKGGNLPDDKIKALDDLGGFDWNVFSPSVARKQTFEESIKKLKEFKEKHGHMNPTQGVNKKLSLFCSNARKSKISKTISEERVKALNEIGFEWEVATVKKSFEERIADLKSFKEKHGHVRVTDTLDKSLSRFCSNIRSARRRKSGSGSNASGMSISEERIQALDELGFEWKFEKKGRGSSVKGKTKQKVSASPQQVKKEGDQVQTEENPTVMTNDNVQDNGEKPAERMNDKDQENAEKPTEKSDDAQGASEQGMACKDDEKEGLEETEMEEVNEVKGDENTIVHL